MCFTCMQGTSATDIAVLAAAWITYIHFRGGHVVAASVELGALLSHLDEGGAGAATHIVIVPHCSTAALELCVKATMDATLERDLRKHSATGTY
jgi:hypothetical protein